MANIPCPECYRSHEATSEVELQCPCGAFINVSRELSKLEAEAQRRKANATMKAKVDKEDIVDNIPLYKLEPQKYEFKISTIALLLLVIVFGYSIVLLQKYIGQPLIIYIAGYSKSINPWSSVKQSFPGLLTITYIVMMSACWFAAYLLCRAFGEIKPLQAPKRFKFSNLFIGFSKGFFLLFCFYSLIALINYLTPTFNLDASKKEMDQYQHFEGWDLFLGLAVAAPVFEEIIFRGYLLKLIEKRAGMFVSVLITSAAFAIAHGYNDLVLGRFFIGIALAVSVYYSGSIIPAIFIHSLNNFVLLLIQADAEHMKIVGPIGMLQWVACAIITLVHFIVVKKREKSKPKPIETVESKKIWLIFLPILLINFIGFQSRDYFLGIIGAWIVSSVILIYRPHPLSNPFSRRKAVIFSIIMLVISVGIYCGLGVVFNKGI